MTPKLLPLLERCIDSGIEQGYRRAFKHSDKPDAGYVQQCVYDAILSELHEWFEFDEQ